MGRTSPGTSGRGNLMSASEPHGQVASIALRAAAGHGFALGGGNALMAHGIIHPRDEAPLPCARARPSDPWLGDRLGYAKQQRQRLR